jgi:flagellar motor switch protein FliN/FliY
VTPEALAQLLAETCAHLCEARTGSTLAGEDAAVRAPDETLWSTTAFPAVVVTIPFDGSVVGESIVVLAPDQALALADGKQDELDLGAVGTTVDGLFEGASAALAERFALELAVGAASARLVADASEIRQLEPDTVVVSYRLLGESIAAEIVQTFPGALVALLEPALAPAEPAEVVSATDQDPAPAGATLVAVERACTVSADAVAGVLSTLFSEDVSAGTPYVEEHPIDPFAGVEYPAIVAEVSYQAGVLGSTRFVLRPADAALLAAAMMGTPETTGDGLSAIELSAVSEAMNQVMTASAGELGAVFGCEIEVSPPTCSIVDTPEQARELAGDGAYRATFRLASTIFGAEIVQLVSGQLADGLAEAFATLAVGPSEAFDNASDFGSAFADLPFAGLGELTPEPPDIRAGAREVLSGIRVRVSAELGRARLPVARVANLPAGSVVMLDRSPTDPVDVLVNGTPFAQARVVLVDGEYAVQILSLTPLELTN